MFVRRTKITITGPIIKNFACFHIMNNPPRGDAQDNVKEIFGRSSLIINYVTAYWRTEHPLIVSMQHQLQHPNGRHNLERGLPLGYWALQTTLARQVFSSSSHSVTKKMGGIKVQLYLGEAFMPCKYLKGNKNVAKYSFIHEFEIFSPFIPYSLFYVCSFVSKEMCLKKTLNTSQYISHFIYPDT